MKLLSTIGLTVISVIASAQQQPPVDPTSVAVPLSWDRLATPGLTGYRLYWGPVGTAGYAAHTNLPPAFTNVTISLPFKEYRWTITALSGSVEGPVSNVVTNHLPTATKLRIGEIKLLFELTVPAK